MFRCADDDGTRLLLAAIWLWQVRGTKKYKKKNGKHKICLTRLKRWKLLLCKRSVVLTYENVNYELHVSTETFFFYFVCEIIQSINVRCAERLELNVAEYSVLTSENMINAFVSEPNECLIKKKIKIVHSFVGMRSCAWLRDVVIGIIAISIQFVIQIASTIFNELWNKFSVWIQTKKKLIIFSLCWFYLRAHFIWDVMADDIDDDGFLVCFYFISFHLILFPIEMRVCCSLGRRQCQCIVCGVHCTVYSIYART